MPRGRVVAIFGLSLAAFLFCGGFGMTAPASAPDQQAGAGFKYQQGWLGADDAYSIPLGGGRSLWVFGDTFIAPSEGAQRSGSSLFIRNSIGITTCASAGKCAIEYFWGHKDGKADSFFTAPVATDWLWPMDGFVHNGVLYIGMMQMHADGKGAFGFAFTGTLLASVPNYTAPPGQWKVTYQELNKGGDALPGVSIVVREGPKGNPDPGNASGASYAYFFTLVQGRSPGDQHLTLTRIPLDKLGSAARPASSAWEYLKRDDSWGPWNGADAALPKDNAIVLTPGATEMTVRYHEPTKKWLAIYPMAFDKTGHYSLSDSIVKGWSSSKPLYEYPEMQPTNPNYAQHVFCYALKEHPEFEQPDKLMFTYACNSTDEKEVYANPNLYRPVMVTLPFPK
jgi:hypothetical protein